MTPPLESKEFPVNEYRPVDGFVNPRTEPVAGSIRLAVTGAAAAPKGEVVLDLLYRGQLISKTIPALYEGTPTYRWIYRPPTGQKASFAIKGDEAPRNGAVAFLIDLSDSMNIKAKGSDRSRFQEAAEGLKKVLGDLPEDTLVSVSFFASSRGGIETKLSPIRWEKSKAEAVYNLVIGQTRDGEETYIANAIRLALQSKEIFPGKEFTGFRNLVVITDGADNVTAAPALRSLRISKPPRRILVSTWCSLASAIGSTFKLASSSTRSRTRDITSDSAARRRGFGPSAKTARKTASSARCICPRS